MPANRGLLIAAIVVVLIAVVGFFAFVNKPAAPAAAAATATALAAAPSPTPLAASSGPDSSGQPGSTTEPSANPATPPPATLAPTPSPTPTPVPPSAVEMPFVPVVDFWSTTSSISMDELRAAASGDSDRYSRVVVTPEDADVIGSLLGGTELDQVSVEELDAAIKEGALGVVRATAVDQRMNALAIDGTPLFGNDRVADVTDWPLTAQVLSDTEWDQSALWTLVAAGDVMLDRGVALAVKNHGEDGDYLFDGGTARVTGIKCCSYFGYPYPTTDRTGNGGALRDLLSGGDIAMANLESAVLVDAPYHAGGLTFTADATLLDAVDAAGLDFMSLANNHVRNGGGRGILTAEEQLDMRGIEHSGGGKGNDASQPGRFDVNGTSVAIISCDAIRPGWVADSPDKVGTFNCKRSDIAGKIRDVKQTADVVIVFPHWGHEYKPAPANYQRELANEWIAAGADMVIGAHSHIAGAIEDIDGHVVMYSLGNLIFDQDFRQSTMMSVIPELTFNGSQLVQIDFHTTLIIDSQPNLVSIADGGQFVIDQMRDGSEGLLDY